MAAASRTQRDWLDSAKSVFASMAAGGASMDRIDFVAYDDRKLMARLDRAFDESWGAEAFSFAAPAILARASFRLVASVSAPGSEPRFHHVRESLVGVRQACQDDVFWRQVASAFGGDDGFARAFVLGHEAGHAILSNESWDFLQECLHATETPLGSSAAWLAIPFAMDRMEDSHARERALALAIEEGVCDAIGCWAAARMGCGDAAKSALALREELKSSSIPAYDTAWMIGQLLPAGRRLEELRFDQLRDAIEALCRKCGAELAARCVPLRESSISEKIRTRSLSQKQIAPYAKYDPS